MWGKANMIDNLFSRSVFFSGDFLPVLTVLHMPVMDGFEAAEKICAWGLLVKNGQPLRGRPSRFTTILP
jgi:CheY-like chemotaxis protein